ATPTQMGFLTAAQTAPLVVVGLVAGAWVDRLPRRPLMIASDIIRAGLLGSIPATALAGLCASSICMWLGCSQALSRQSSTSLHRLCAHPGRTRSFDRGQQQTVLRSLAATAATENFFLSMI